MKERAQAAILARIIELAPDADALQLQMLAEAYSQASQVRVGVKDTRATFVG